MYLMASSPTQGYRFCLLSATTAVDAAWLARMVGLQYALVSPFPTQRFLTSGRLLGLKQGRVRFRWRDSKDHNQIKETSGAVEFIRGFLPHLLPGGFVKTGPRIHEWGAVRQSDFSSPNSTVSTAPT